MSGSAVNDRLVVTLDALTRRPVNEPWGVRELAAEAHLSRSTVHRVLQALTECDLAAQTANATYSFGPRLRVLMDNVHRTHPLFCQARPLAEQLAATCDATILLSLYDPIRTEAFVALAAVPDGPLRYRLDPGKIIPLHAGAAGRAILAELGPEVLERLDLIAYTADTVTDRATLARSTRQSHQDGITISIGQHVALAAGVAAPLRVAGLTGAISATRLRHETTTEDLERFAVHVRNTVDEISRLAREAVPAAQHTAEPVSLTGRGVDERGSAADRLERLLTALATGAPLPTGGRALARLLSGNPATAARLLDAAYATGLAAPRDDQAQVGPLLLRWAASLGSLPSAGVIAAPVLEALAHETGETIGLTEYRPATRTAHMTTVVSGSKPIHYSLPTDTETPLAAGAAGKAILAFLPENTLSQLPLVMYTDNTPLDRTHISDDLRQVRERGWAQGDGERIADAFGIAVPYFINHSVAGSVTATIPRHQAEQLNIDDLIRRLAEAARTLTRLLSLQ
ncbi:helix-turn-helix domain-containing protein [Streptomyces sp. CA-278952]|uniref:IclR family transcriptional regulator n=1 Tax=Streptomyces sp. CA-278952 TaxID=2980556 RepID=UPI002368CA25|nr:IclR family transcriptional regulator C-terminal domain-containing protein [Streptomyces sp. CA-278952]WDG29803.1 helix-turn-helix domain-containing protein [Streptomyces sp. CA-278952]